MRRILTTLSASVLLLVLTALPALAAEEAVAEESLFYGLQVTAIAALVFGAFVFFDAYATGPHVEDDHDDHHH